MGHSSETQLQIDENRCKLGRILFEIILDF